MAHGRGAGKLSAYRLVRGRWSLVDGSKMDLNWDMHASSKMRVRQGLTMPGWGYMGIGFVLLLAGCSGREAIDFNNRVAAVHSQVGMAAEQFAEALRPFVDEARRPTEDEFDAAAEKLRRALAAARQASGELRLPDLPEADALHAAHEEFLTSQEVRLNAEVTAIRRLWADENLNAETLFRTLQSRLASLKEDESARLEALHAAQQRFAEANGLKLTRPAGG